MVRGCDGRYSGCRYKGCSTRRKGEREGMRTRRTEGGRGWARTGKGGILESGLALKYTPREIPGVN